MMMITGPILHVFFSQRPLAGTTLVIGPIRPPPNMHIQSQKAWKIFIQQLVDP